MRFRTALPLVAVLLTSPVAADTPGSKQTTDPIPGYKRQEIEGFTVLINQQVFEQKADNYKRKPLEVLELELKTIVRIMQPKALEVLRRLLIWIEWDDKEDTGGRRGTTVAVYYGGHQLNLLKEGKHPLKAKNITIVSLKTLTEGHQPESDSGRCVILHEMAHAVHYQLVGKDDQRVKAAYQQAMERKLYDKTLYAGTDEKEFFAELSCAYLDQLPHYPYTRQELEKYDPATYKLMEAVWGKQKEDAIKSRNKPDYSLDVRLDGMTLGPPLSGPKVRPEDLKGRVVLLTYWDGEDDDSLMVLHRLATWDKELRYFGLAVLGPHQRKVKPEDIRAVALARGVEFPVVGPTMLKGAGDAKVSFPHAVLLDHTGKCVYRGSPFELEKALRAAVGKALVAGTNKTGFTKQAQPLVKDLEEGKPPATVLQEVVKRQKNQQLDAAEARPLIEALTAAGQKLLEDAEAVAKDDPVEAFLRAEPLAALYRNTPLGTKAGNLVTRLKKEKAVYAELLARPTLEEVRKLDQLLDVQPGSFDPKRPEFQKAHLATLKQMQDKLQLMRKTWPDTRATQEASRLGEKYGLAAR